MHKAPKAFIFFILLVFLFSSASTFPGIITNAAQDAPWQSKVDAWVLETGTKGETEFLVFLTEQADLSGAADLPTKLEKGAYVYQQLTEVAARTQPALLSALQARGVEYRPYWVANMVWVRGGLDAVQAMSMRADVARIHANPQVKVDLPAPDLTIASPSAPQAIEWNILEVNADDVWAAGFTGQGVVIGGQDTGYEWDHPALKNQYRGWNGTSADHNYNWHDAIHSGTSDCGPNSPVPCDDNDHGTHTMGTMVGDDGGSNQIGMAPGARWIGCRNMNEKGVGSPASYSECYQWFIAPTDLNGQNADPSKAPDVINNSWGCTISEGCTDPNVLLPVVNAVRAAGILTVHSAGNKGLTGCSSINEPPAIYEASYTVGATDISDNIASFSSRGPVTIDGSGRLKPDISAPGVNIRSSVPGGGYEGGWQGTSMAAPHVAGLVGLLISANPGLAGQVELLEYIINQSALPRTTAQSCGGIPGSQIPNNTYGYGRIDALSALQNHNLSISKSTSAAEVYPGGLITYTLGVTHINPVYPTTNVVLTDTLPAGTAFVRATQPYSFDGSRVRWDIASMAAIETQSVEMVVRVHPTTRGIILNDNFGVRSDDAGTVLGDPVSVDIVTLEGTLTKTAPDIVAPNGILTYTLTVSNPYGDIPIHNLVLTDTLPASTEFITASLPVTISDDLITWKLVELPAGETWSVQLAVQAPLVFAGTVVNDRYGVRSDEVTAVLGSPVSTQVHSLALAKSAVPELADIGDLITYTLAVTNQHPSDTINGILLADSLPEHTGYASSDGGFDSISGEITWTNIPDLAPGDVWTGHLTVRVLPGAISAVVNEDYRVTSTQTPEPLYGKPVSTRLQIYVYFPLMFKGYGG